MIYIILALIITIAVIGIISYLYNKKQLEKWLYEQPEFQKLVKKFIDKEK